jgi:stringent starvation protein B
MQPYLLRAVHEWITENDFTAYILVNADYESCEVPREYVDNGNIILNISTTAVQNLVLDNDLVSFNARFSGQQVNVSIPIPAVLAIYAQENGKGMSFQAEPEGNKQVSPPPKKPTLTLVE